MNRAVVKRIAPPPSLNGITLSIELSPKVLLPSNTARFTTPSGREIQGKGLDPDLAVTSLKLARLAQGQMRREADLPGALKNPDQAGSKLPADAPPGATPTPPPEEAPAVATEDMGSASDEQLVQAIDVLRGLSVFNRRAAG